MKTPIADPTICRNVIQLLASRGLRSPCHINVQSRNGVVTLSGTVLRLPQRDSAEQITQNVEGVRRVINGLSIKPPVKQSFEQTYVRPLTDEEVAAKAAQALLEAAMPVAPAEPFVQKYDKQGNRIKVPALPPSVGEQPK